MLLPLSLLKSFLPLQESVSDIEQALTLLGLEVDKVHAKNPPFCGVIAAEILAVKPHPQSDQLSLVEINDGKKTEWIVCGAKNCRPKMKVPFASAEKNACLLDAKGGPLKIGPATIRGVLSPGMLCSSSELGLKGNSEGILELPQDIPIGTDLVDLLWDPVFEISLTPNLGHCLSALGVARELSAAWNRPLHRKPLPVHAPSEISPFKVAIKNAMNCPLYRCQLIEGVKIGPSPFWLQQILLAVGMKPINNVVDITNYVLLKWGQPMHAFDAGKLHGHTIFVEELEKDTSLITLDQIERTVFAKTLCILDGKGPIAIAGIMGGKESSVTEHTTRVLLEAAVFDPKKIRSGSKALQLKTESALRFEKGVDTSALSSAFEEAIALLISSAEGELIGTFAEVKSPAKAPLVLPLRVERTNRLLGTHLSFSEIETLLQRLGFKTELAQIGTFHVAVPSHRFDVAEEIDLVEEIARLYGLNNIEKKDPLYTQSNLPHDPAYLFEEALRTAAISHGLSETLTSDLISPKLASLVKESHVSLLKTLHAKTEEYSILRPSLLPGMLHTLRRNLDQKTKDMALFEIGRIHFLDVDRPIELPMLALLLTGNNRPPHWSIKKTPFDFYDLKGLIESLFATLSLPKPTIRPSHNKSFHPQRGADLFLGDLRIGSFGELHPRFCVEERVYFAEIDLDTLPAHQKTRVKMRPLPQYPNSERDITLTAPLDRLVETYFDAVQSLKETRLEKMELIDLYYPENKKLKNLTFRFSYRDPTMTLSFDEVEALHQKITTILESV